MRETWTRREVVGLLALGTLALACGRTAAVPAPENVVPGRDECRWCRMLIDEPRLPAQFAVRGGRVEKFGEPGCLLAWLAAHPDLAGVAFVTVEDGAWLAAGDARFTVGMTRTPMAFDIAAYRSAPPGADDVAWTDLLREGAPHVRSS
jgi:copper chaperone NosL